MRLLFFFSAFKLVDHLDPRAYCIAVLFLDRFSIVNLGGLIGLVDTLSKIASSGPITIRSQDYDVL